MSAPDKDFQDGRGLSVFQSKVLPYNVDSSSESDLACDDGTRNPQNGTAKMESVTAVWSKWQLWLTVGLIYTLMIVQSLSNDTLGLLSAYATSSFKSHELLPILAVLSGIVSAVISLPMSKILNVFGRAEALVIVGALDCLGNIITASSSNVGTYFGAHVIFYLGETSIAYIVTIIVSDISTLRSRMFYLALVNTPFVFTTWMGAPIAESLVNHSTWRWGYGMFAILIPIVIASVCAILFYNQVIAARQKRATIEDATPKPSKKQQVLNLLNELDIVGLVLLGAGFCLLLLAITLAKANGSTWKSTHIIVMLVVGPLCIIAFIPWEKYVANKPVVPYELITNRTILGSALAGACFRAAFFMWDTYYSSHLQVVNHLSITHAGYIANIYNVVSCLWGPILGLIVQRVDRVRIVAFCILPLHLLGAGLMIKYRTEDSPLVALVFCQILIAWGGGSLVQLEQIAAMSVVNHDRIPSALAFKALITYIGGSIGGAVCAAVWTNTMLQRVENYLPSDKKHLAQAIYSSLTVQLKYKPGTPERIAITLAYQDSQRILTIIATALVAFGTLFIFMWKNVRLSEKPQVAGRVL